MPDVSAVAAGDDFTLDLTFANGERRRFDMSPWLHLPVFQALRDPASFRKAKVCHGTVSWPGEIDVAPERLYADGKPIAE